MVEDQRRMIAKFRQMRSYIDVQNTRIQTLERQGGEVDTASPRMAEALKQSRLDAKFKMTQLQREKEALQATIASLRQQMATRSEAHHSHPGAGADASRRRSDTQHPSDGGEAPAPAVAAASAVTPPPPAAITSEHASEGTAETAAGLATAALNPSASAHRIAQLEADLQRRDADLADMAHTLQQLRQHMRASESEQRVRRATSPPPPLPPVLSEDDAAPDEASLSVLATEASEATEATEPAGAAAATEGAVHEVANGTANGTANEIMGDGDGDASASSSVVGPTWRSSEPNHSLGSPRLEMHGPGPAAMSGTVPAPFTVTDAREPLESGSSCDTAPWVAERARLLDQLDGQRRKIDALQRLADSAVKAQRTAKALEAIVQDHVAERTERQAEYDRLAKQLEIQMQAQASADSAVQALPALQAELRALRSDHVQLQSDHAAQAAAHQALVDEMRGLTARADALAAQRDALQAQYVDVADRDAAQARDHGEAQARITALEQTISQLQAGARAQLQQLQTERDSSEREVQRVSQAFAAYKAQARRALAQQSNDVRASQIAELTAARADLAEQLAAATRQTESLVAEAARYRAQIATLEAREGAHRDEIQAAARELQRLQSEYDALHRLQARHDHDHGRDRAHQAEHVAHIQSALQEQHHRLSTAHAAEMETFRGQLARAEQAQIGQGQVIERLQSEQMQLRKTLASIQTRDEGLATE
ncbi:hypothetical protein CAUPRSCDRAFT_12014, partial [Caulochytrium protostelioides]